MSALGADGSVSIMIRRLDSGDEANLAARAIAEVKWEGEPPTTLEGLARWMRDWLEDEANVLLVALADGTPAGFALGYILSRVDASGRMLFLYEIEVLEPFRRCGLGRMLVERMKRVGRSGGVVKMWVQTDLDNGAARALYEQCGGRLTDAPYAIYVWTSDELGESERR